MDDIETWRGEIPCPVHVFKGAVPPGPYFAERSTGRIFQAGRLYQDTHAAFVFGPNAVLSRLYQQPTQAQPLSGVSMPASNIDDQVDMI